MLKNTFSLFSKTLYNPYLCIGTDDTAMLWGVQFYNDMLMQNGPSGNAQSELLFMKDKTSFSFEQGWAFPRRVYFNGDNCVMPPPDAYPFLPNESASAALCTPRLIAALLVSLVSLFLHHWLV